MSREPVRRGALLSAALLAGLLVVPAASAQQPCQSCESCGYETASRVRRGSSIASRGRRG